MRTILALAFAATAWAQATGTTPKPKPDGYPAHSRAGDVAIAAEYLMHTLPSGTRQFVIPKYLVIEVAIYPPRAGAVEVANTMFSLRVNGRKELRPHSPEMAAYSVRYAEQNQQRGIQAAAGPVVIGRAPRSERFPGDPSADREPPVARVPQPAHGGVERQEPETAPEAIARTAFPDVRATGPVSGFLFFEFQGKMKSIESLELVFHSGEGAIVRLL